MDIIIPDWFLDSKNSYTNVIAEAAYQEGDLFIHCLLQIVFHLFPSFYCVTYQFREFVVLMSPIAY